MRTRASDSTTTLDQIKKLIDANPKVAASLDVDALSEAQMRTLIDGIRSHGKELRALQDGDPAAREKCGSVDELPFLVARCFGSDCKKTQTAAVQNPTAGVNDSVSFSGSCPEPVPSPRRLSVKGRFLDGAEVIISNPRVLGDDGQPKVLFRGPVESKPTSPFAPREDDGWTDSYFRIPPDEDWFGDDPLLVQQKMGDERASEPALIQPEGQFNTVRPRFIDTSCIDPRALFRSGQIKAGPGAALPHSKVYAEYNGARIAEIDVQADGSFAAKLPKGVNAADGPVELFAPGRGQNKATAILNPMKGQDPGEKLVFGWQRSLREALTQTPNAKCELSFDLSGLPSGYSLTISRQDGGSECFTANAIGELSVRLRDVKAGYALSVKGDAFVHRDTKYEPSFSARPAAAGEAARLNMLNRAFPNVREDELGTIHELFGAGRPFADIAACDVKAAYKGYGLARVVQQSYPMDRFEPAIQKHFEDQVAPSALIEGFEKGLLIRDVRLGRSHSLEGVGLRLAKEGDSRHIAAGGQNMLRPELSTNLYPATRVGSSEYSLEIPGLAPLTLRTKARTVPR